MTQDDLLYRFRLRVFAMAGELGNVRAACRAMGIHPSTFYRWKRQLDRHGPEVLRPRERRPPRMANQTSVLVERILPPCWLRVSAGPVAKGRRWRVGEAFQADKGLCGLDQYQGRRRRSWYRWVTLAMLAFAFLFGGRTHSARRHQARARVCHCRQQANGP